MDLLESGRQLRPLDFKLRLKHFNLELSLFQFGVGFFEKVLIQLAVLVGLMQLSDLIQELGFAGAAETGSILQDSLKPIAYLLILSSKILFARLMLVFVSLEFLFVFGKRVFDLIVLHNVGVTLGSELLFFGFTHAFGFEKLSSLLSFLVRGFLG